MFGPGGPMIKKCFLFGIFAFFGPISLWGQGLELACKITDQDGMPLSEANLELYRLDVEALPILGLSSEDGLFIFKNIRSGVYKVVVSKDAYGSVTRTLSIRDQTVFLQITMRMINPEPYLYSRPPLPLPRTGPTWYYYGRPYPYPNSHYHEHYKRHDRFHRDHDFDRGHHSHGDGKYRRGERRNSDHGHGRKYRDD